MRRAGLFPENTGDAETCITICTAADPDYFIDGRFIAKKLFCNVFIDYNTIWFKQCSSCITFFELIGKNLKEIGICNETFGLIKRFHFSSVELHLEQCLIIPEQIQ